MIKTKVTLDSFYKLFPDDATTINVEGKRSLIISDYINDDVDVVTVVLNREITKITGFNINGNGVFQLPDNSTALSFSVANEPKYKASFIFEVQ
jgi:hypothetical protein